MSDNFAFELVSPEKLLISKQVNMVVAPGAEGDFGVLAHHAPMIITLRAGLLTLTENGTETDKVFVAGGFAEITPDRCTILAEEAIAVKDLNKSEIDGKLQKLHDQKALAETEQDHQQLDNLIAIETLKKDFIA